MNYIIITPSNPLLSELFVEAFIEVDGGIDLHVDFLMILEMTKIRLAWREEKNFSLYFLEKPWDSRKKERIYFSNFSQKLKVNLGLQFSNKLLFI